MSEPCLLCYAISKEGNQQIENTVFYETERFVVIPTLGQFIEGWLMIVSKTHINSALNLDTKSLKELSQVIETCMNSISKIYGQSIVFEHGPGTIRGMTGGCCINHTHLHIVPCKSPEKFRSLIPFPRTTKIEIIELANSNRINNPSGYLLIGLDDNTFYEFCEVDTILPRQYLRQVIAVTEGVHNFWDWRIFPHYENILKTIESLELSFVD